MSVIDLIQQNLIAYFRLFAAVPGNTFVAGAVTWFLSAGGEPGNYVVRTQLAPEAVDLLIGRLLDHLGRQADHVDWLVFPSCRPADLGKRLEKRGLVGSPGGTWMWANLATLPAASPLPKDFTVRLVSDDAELAIWRDISAEGYAAVDSEAQIYYNVYARHGYGSAAYSLHYIGYRDEEPVTSATLLLSGGIAGIYNVSTPPAQRRRGYGSAITAFVVQEAIRRGFDTAWLLPSDMGKGVYERLGFVVTDFGVHEYSWRTAAAGS
jgi:GNAT superfamily N-acetyltransferase